VSECDLPFVPSNCFGGIDRHPVEVSEPRTVLLAAELGEEEQYHADVPRRLYDLSGVLLQYCWVKSSSSRF
jgi:hypothetical protein